MDKDTLQRLRSDPRTEQLRRTLRAAASLLEVARVSVWAYGETGEVLHRLAQHDGAAGRDRETPGRIGREEYPVYFRALRGSSRIVAADVYGDRRLREFRRPYASELGVRSWLDLPLERGDSPLGRLRVEHVGPARDWDDDELTMARSLAELLSLVVLSEERAPAKEPSSDSRTLQARESALFRENPAALAVVDLPDTILDCNAAFARLVGAESIDEIEGSGFGGFFRDASVHGDLLEQMRRTGTATDLEARIRTPEGETRWLLLYAAVLPERARDARQIEADRYVLTAFDVTDRKRMEDRLEEQAYRDPLTDLANRRLLDQTAERLLPLARRHDRKAGLVYVDLDHFKDVNDRFGHLVGDRVLSRIADRLRDSVRAGDLVARIGGDEFVVLLSEIESEQNLETTGERIETILSRPFDVDVETGADQETFEIGATTGLALFPDDGEDIDALVRHGDRAMYRSKAEGES